jgi:hypothetical protein
VAAAAPGLNLLHEVGPTGRTLHHTGLHMESNGHGVRE